MYLVFQLFGCVRPCPTVTSGWLREGRVCRLVFSRGSKSFVGSTRLLGQLTPRGRFLSRLPNPRPHAWRLHTSMRPSVSHPANLRVIKSPQHEENNTMKRHKPHVNIAGCPLATTWRWTVRLRPAQHIPPCRRIGRKLGLRHSNCSLQHVAA